MRLSHSRSRSATFAAAVVLLFQIGAIVYGHYAPRRFSNMDGTWTPAVGHHVTADRNSWFYFSWGDQWAVRGDKPLPAATRAGGLGLAYSNVPGFIRFVSIHSAWTIVPNVFLLGIFAAHWRNVRFLGDTGLLAKMAAAWHHCKGYRIRIVHCP